MCLQALAQASVDASFDVLHAQTHVYDLELLGYDVSTNAKPKLALDDGSAEFPTSKQPRADAHPLEDGDVDPADIGCDNEGDAANLVFDTVEEMSIAELGLEAIEDANDQLDDDNGDEGNEEDDERRRTNVNPSELNHWWGAFRFTLKRDAVSRVFSWQCTCPFHMKKEKTTCRKTHTMRSHGGLSFAAESD